MKKIITYSSAVLVLLGLAAACAKQPTTSSKVSAKEYFDAWMLVNHPDAEPTPLGAYVIEETEGDGRLVGDADESPYLLVSYVVRDLDGTITDFSDESVAHQLDKYDETYYYGTKVWGRGYNALYAGVDEAVSTMRVGGSKTTVIPGWLFTVARYDDPQEYVEKVSGTNSIYEITLHDIIDDITEWEMDSIGRYLARNYPQLSLADSLKYGFYYIQEKAPDDTAAFPADSGAFINYIGRRLDGQVFDTNIEDTAKVYGLYSSSVDYSPIPVRIDPDNYENVKMVVAEQEVTLIDGFAYALWRMRSHEKATCIFYSNLGYGSAGSSDRIPGYSPLRFDIEFVDEPEEDE